MKPDQTDLIAQVERLTSELATANTTLTTVRADVTRLTSENATLQTQLTEARTATTTAQGQVTALTASLNASKADVTAISADRDQWKEKAEPIQKQLATELSKHGIRKTAVAPETKSNTDKPLTATEKCLAANGFGSLAD